jgi:hypothetical protein
MADSAIVVIIEEGARLVQRDDFDPVAIEVQDDRRRRAGPCIGVAAIFSLGETVILGRGTAIRRFTTAASAAARTGPVALPAAIVYVTRRWRSVTCRWR